MNTMSIYGLRHFPTLLVSLVLSYISFVKHLGGLHALHYYVYYFEANPTSKGYLLSFESTCNHLLPKLFCHEYFVEVNIDIDSMIDSDAHVLYPFAPKV